MYKKTLIGLASAAAVLLPFASFAAANITTLEMDGYANVTRQISDEVDAVVRVNLTGATNVESASYEFLGSGHAQICYNVEPDQIAVGNNKYVKFPMSLPSHPGTWDVRVRLF